MVATDQQDAGAHSEPGPTRGGVGGAHGARLLASDVWVAFMLINDARYRAMERVFGVGKGEANVVTLVGALVLAETAHQRMLRLRATPPPAASDLLLGAATVREVMREIVGPPSRDTPMLGMLLTLALFGGPARRAAAKSLHAFRSSSHQANVAFHRRYGYLVDPGHWRERRAQRVAPRAGRS